MAQQLTVNPQEINVKLLGDAAKDVELAELLLKELQLLRKSARSEEQQFEVKWKSVALVKRCCMVAAVHQGSDDAMETAMDGVRTIGAEEEQMSDPSIDKIFDEYVKRKERQGGSKGASADAVKREPEKAVTQVERVTTDEEAMEKLLAFYKAVNPSKTRKDVTRIWSKGRTDPKTLYKKYQTTYPGDAETHLQWMPSFPPAPAPSEKPGAPPAAKPKPKPKQSEGVPGTPQGGKGPGVVGSLIGAIASPVVRLFRPDVDEPDCPQAILPTDEDEQEYFFDDKEGRWVFRNDPEGEAERKALAEAKKGPPPKPKNQPDPNGPPAPPAPSSGPTLRYVDPFNSGGASAVQPAPPAPPPMPPMPVFADETEKPVIDARQVVS